MSGSVDTQAHGPGVPDVEGRRRFEHESDGVGPDPGAPDVEGRTSAARGADEEVGSAHAQQGRALGDPQPFVVTFTFATMPIVSRACTLDAVLGGEIARTVASLDEAIAATPLRTTAGVSHASSLVELGDTGVTRSVPVVQRARAALDGLTPGQIPKGCRRTDRFGGKNVLNRYPMRVCDGGLWFGTGRIAQVREILAGVLGIGKRRAAGAGMIDADSLAVEPVDANPATWGLVTTPDDGEFATSAIVPVRPLPLELFCRLGGDPGDAVMVVERVRQPYHDARNVPEPAVVPWP